MLIENLTLGDQKPTKNNSQFKATIGPTPTHIKMENYELCLKDANVRIQKKATENVIKSNKCNQCGYTSSQAGNLRQHLKMHSGEKSNKCNQCDYASSYLLMSVL